MRAASLIPLFALLVSGCNPDDPSGSPDAGPGDPDPDCEPGIDCPDPDPDPDPVPLMWSFDDVFGLPNLDADDMLPGIDFNKPPYAADDDFSTLLLPADLLDAMPDGNEVVLLLTGDINAIKVYRGQQLVLGAAAGGGPYRFAPPGGDVELVIEFGAYLARGTLVVAHVDAANQTVDTDEVLLQASPLITNHHLQPVEHVWAVQVNGNPAFIQGLQTALGSAFTAVPGWQYGGDVWIQDEYEWATATGAEGQRLNVIIDSIRNRGIDPYARNNLRGPGTITSTWGSGPANTYDAFGNLEASPPVTVGGVEYPFGRIYYGRVGNAGPHPTLRAFLSSQKVQAPIELPTNWLCVGHVDEIITFVPDASSPKGFKLLFADVPSAWSLLEGLPSGFELPRYTNSHGYSSVGAMLSHADLRALNDDLQTFYLDPILAQLKQELNLTEADVIRVPSLFERACGPRVAALIPGMVNMLVAEVAGKTHLFIPDPFFRQFVDQSTDPIIADFASRLPAGFELHFLDNWFTYHMGLGEVHCGTNSMRTPIADWWTEALHLLEVK